jgi:predicted RNA-binding Zn-ribbon protein involved in translation (DUF1610 family)
VRIIVNPYTGKMDGKYYEAEEVEAMKKSAKTKAAAQPATTLTCPVCGAKHAVQDARCDDCKRSGKTDPA